jgi:glucosylceramidase
MRFILAGAWRVASESPSKGTANVAFWNPDGSLVLVLAHPGSRTREVVVEWKGRTCTATLTAKSVATFRWLP